MNRKAHAAAAYFSATLAVTFAIPICAASETTIYSLPCYPLGNAPYAGLVMDKTGDLFGTSFAGGSQNTGTVFELQPPAMGSTAWTGGTIYSFGSQTQAPPLTDATSSQAPLLLLKNGTLIGTGYYSNDFGCGGDGCGAAFSLVPPSGGSTTWTEQAIYDFQGAADGANPAAGLTMGSAGSYFGTTQNGGPGQAGTIYRLVAPAHKGAPWTESVIFGFSNGADGGFPVASLILDSAGALYGTTPSSGSGGGTVFKLNPPVVLGGPWTETVLYTFGLSGAPTDGDQPEAGLVADATGALYGTTLFGGFYGKGIVFKLTPPGSGQTAWTETTLHSFADGADGALPTGQLLLKGTDTLYGTTEGTGNTGSYGTVFRLTPPANGGSRWKEKTLYVFSGGADGQYPLSSLVSDKQGNLYGTTLFGGAQKCGAVFQVTP